MNPSPPHTGRLGAWAQRIARSTVLWSWCFNGLRLGSAIIVLPLLLRALSPDELGVHYVLLNLLALLPAVDVAIGVNTVRFVSYAMGGARELAATGMTGAAAGAPPNYALVWRLADALQRLYRWLALVLVLVLAPLGYLILHGRMQAWEDPMIAWLALALTVISAALDIYWSWWNSILKGMDKVREAVHFLVVGYGLRLVLSAVLLMAGAGLLALPLAGIVGGFTQRSLARRHCLRLLLPHRPEPAGRAGLSLIDTLLPNSWRVGLQLLSQFGAISALTYLCVDRFGLETQGRYGLSLQVFNIATSMAAVWIGVKWQSVSRLRIQGRFDELRHLVHQRFALQNLTYLALAVAAVLAGPRVIELVNRDNSLLPVLWLVLLAVNAGLEMNFSFWSMVMSTENRIPSLWPTVATNLAAVLLAGALVFRPGGDVGALVVAPLVAGALFNYWYWIWRGQRSLRPPQAGAAS